ncbi:hypothetical protein KM043_000961 [Ampulex compressa]|nr:hypothetical protein KM043_000961 [Ampulex compressa]
MHGDILRKRGTPLSREEEERLWVLGRFAAAPEGGAFRESARWPERDSWIFAARAHQRARYVPISWRASERKGRSSSSKDVGGSRRKASREGPPATLLAEVSHGCCSDSDTPSSRTRSPTGLPRLSQASLSPLLSVAPILADPSSPLHPPTLFGVPVFASIRQLRPSHPPPR